MERPKMECDIPGKNLRLFASCIQCLAKVGKELSLSAKRDRGTITLTLNTMNDAKTSFCNFVLYESFFEKFVLQGGRAVCVKIPIKSILSAVKSVRTAERMKISFLRQGPRHVAVFCSQCKGGLVKTHELHYEETGLVEAQFDRTGANNKLCLRTSLLTHAFGQIFGAEEASLAVEKDECIRLRSHYQHVDQSEMKKTLKTEVRIPNDDLDAFLVHKDGGEVSFGMKEIKALLSFCETAEVYNICVMFTNPGEPLLFSTDQSLSEMQQAYPEQTSGDQVQFLKVELLVASLDAEAVDNEEEGEAEHVFDPETAQAGHNQRIKKPTSPQRSHDERPSFHPPLSQSSSTGSESTVTVQPIRTSGKKVRAPPGYSPSSDEEPSSQELELQGFKRTRKI